MVGSKVWEKAASLFGMCCILVSKGCSGAEPASEAELEISKSGEMDSILEGY
jgi:hypothetical protein